jgi:SAM-dependent methyltransferase
MNALELRYEDESFDGIFSSGSIEHFGDLDNIHQSVVEMYRVLKPGGVVGLATEFRLAGPPPGLPGTVLFDESELRQVLLDGLDWELASPLDFSISDETMAAPVDFDRLVEIHLTEPSLWMKLKDALGMDVEPPQTAVRHLPTPHPHIVLRKDDYLWTSVHVALIKPGG